MFRRLLSSISIIFSILAVAGIIIAYGRGYRLDFQKKSLTTTGILSASSFPDGASVFINNKLTSATNTSLSLSPGWYQIKIGKAGYQSWEKSLRIQGEVVSRAEALLVPINPSLGALTVTGIISPALSPSGVKFAYLVPEETATSSSSFKTKSGVWVFDLKTGPLGGKSVPREIFQPSLVYNFQQSRLFWSPDEKQLILTFFKLGGKKETVIAAFLLSAENNTPAMDITSSYLSLMEEWQKDLQEKEQIQLANLPSSISSSLSGNIANLRLSPDETKILYLATASATLPPAINPPLIGSNPTPENRKIEAGKLYVYDIKEDKNFFLTDKKTLPSLEAFTWYSDSKHILMIEKDTIYIVDYDGTNKRAIYSGPFKNEILCSWPSGGRVIILTSFNKPQVLPNLYEIDLR